MSLTREQIVDMISVSVEALTDDLSRRIGALTQQLEGLNPRVETYESVTIARGNRGNTLDLIKSLPEFRGEMSAYPAWRDAAQFAMDYYPEGTENYYIAMGIFRNRIVGAANAKLSSFNTVLNFKAIISRLDQCYADKRSLQALENELSILRQGGKTISDFYDEVDAHLTLIINKNKMSYSGNDEVVIALNERARENALRVFISGLRRPLNDILFSTRPSDLPTALATAQELESDQRRQEFARIFAAGDLAKTSRPQRRGPNHPSVSHPAYKPINGFPKTEMKINPFKDGPSPMDVDPGSSMFRRPTANMTQQQQQVQQPQEPFNNKRRYESSGRTAPVPKAQRINHIAVEEDPDDYEDDINSIFEYSQDEEQNADVAFEELNFLE